METMERVATTARPSIAPRRQRVIGADTEGDFYKLTTREGVRQAFQKIHSAKPLDWEREISLAEPSKWGHWKDLAAHVGVVALSVVIPLAVMAGTVYELGHRR